MRRFRAYALMIPAALLPLSCSSNYSDVAEGEPPMPEIVLNGAVASRFSSARLSVAFRADRLEIYDSDSVWAGDNVSFTQYADDGSGKLEAEGTAGLLLVDNASEVYSLGDTVSFSLASEKITFSAPDLKWAKKDHWLQAPTDGLVTVSKEDGTVISGTGFCADTLAWKYEMSESAKGEMRESDAAASDQVPGEGPAPDTAASVAQPAAPVEPVTPAQPATPASQSAEAAQ